MQINKAIGTIFPVKRYSNNLKRMNEPYSYLQPGVSMRFIKRTFQKATRI